ncbi:hypothetical protein QJQ45_023203, partial [Haematococcus lacustris]
VARQRGLLGLGQGVVVDKAWLERKANRGSLLRHAVDANRQLEEAHDSWQADWVDWQAAGGQRNTRPYPPSSPFAISPGCSCKAHHIKLDTQVTCGLMRAAGMLPADITSLTKFRNGVAGPKDSELMTTDGGGQVRCVHMAGSHGTGPRCNASSPTCRVRKRKSAVRDSGLQKSTEQKRSLYHCTYCQKDITHTPRIRCAECPNNFDLCLECFAVGAELVPHKAWHDYRVLTNLSFPIFHPDWGVSIVQADEEQLLLEGIDQFGLGNWAAVAESMGSSKTAQQCKLHYFATYIDVDTYPLPSPSPSLMMSGHTMTPQPLPAPGESSLLAGPSLSAVTHTAPHHTSAELTMESQTAMPAPAELAADEPQSAASHDPPADSADPTRTNPHIKRQSPSQPAPGSQTPLSSAVADQVADAEQAAPSQLPGSSPSETVQQSHESAAKQSLSKGQEVAADAQQPADVKMEDGDVKGWVGDPLHPDMQQQEEEEGSGASVKQQTEAGLQSVGTHPTMANSRTLHHEGQGAPGQAVEAEQQVKAEPLVKTEVQANAEPGLSQLLQPPRPGSAAEEDPTKQQAPALAAAAGDLLQACASKPVAVQQATSTQPMPLPAAGGAQLPGSGAAGGRQGGDKTPAAGVAAKAAGAAAQPLAQATPPTTAAQSAPAAGKELVKPAHAEGDAIGFLGKRDEFEHEYDQDAECVVADMEFLEDEPEADRQLKLRMLAIYNQRLDARDARRRFLRDYGLLAMRKVQAMERRRTPAEQETDARLRVFARYSSCKEHDELVDGLIIEQRLRSRIQELKEMRSLGCRTLDECDAVEAALEPRPRKRLTANNSHQNLLLLPAQGPSSTGAATGPAVAPTSSVLTPVPSIASGLGEQTGSGQEHRPGSVGGNGLANQQLLAGLQQQLEAWTPAADTPLRHEANGWATPAPATTPGGWAATAAVVAGPQGGDLTFPALPGMFMAGRAAAAPGMGPGPEASRWPDLGAVGAGTGHMAAGGGAAAANGMSTPLSISGAPGGEERGAGAVPGKGPAGGGLEGPAGRSSALAGMGSGAQGDWRLERAATGGKAIACASGVPLQGSKGSGPALALWHAQRGVALDITCMPGVNLLSAQERELCSVLRLLPVHYLAMKDMMLREADKHGSITRTKARTFFRLDPARSLKMYDLWVSCGWVSGPRAAAARAAAASDTATASEADP